VEKLGTFGQAKIANKKQKRKKESLYE